MRKALGAQMGHNTEWGLGHGAYTTRETLTAGGQNSVIPGGLQTAGDHLAGGNTLPPAVCKPPGVSLVSAGCLCQPPGILLYRRRFANRQG